MKICFITYNILSLGGVQRVVSVIANELSKFYEVDIICTANGNKVDNELYKLDEKINVILENDLLKKSLLTDISSKIIRKINKKTNLLNNNNFVGILEHAYYPKEIQERFIKYFNSKEYDLIIGVEGQFSVLLGSISDRLKAKTMGWEHNSYDAYLNNISRYYWKQDLLFRKYLPKLNSCIVLTIDDERKYKKYLNTNAVTIYNPLSFNSEVKSKCINKNILFVGRLVEMQKGLDLLVESFKKVIEMNQDWELTIVGDGEDREKLINNISKNGLENYIKVLPFTDNVQKHYLDASIFVSTSRWEGFGLVITEAMECGVPVVAFENSGPLEIINKDGVNGILVPCEDINKFSKELLNLIDNPDYLKSIATESVKRANDFKIDKIVSRWREIIDTL